MTVTVTETASRPDPDPARADRAAAEELAKATDPCWRGLAGRVARAIEGLDVTEHVRECLWRVHGWVMGEEHPPAAGDDPRIRVTCLYGLCYLGATAGVPLDGSLAATQVRNRRLYLRLAVDVVWRDAETPEHIRSMIATCMESLGLPPRYDWHDRGEEIVMLWSRQTRTLFVPLRSAVTASARTFLLRPDATESREAIDEWAGAPLTYAGILHLQRLSPVHGPAIGRILGCWHTLAGDGPGGLDIPDLRAVLDGLGPLPEERAPAPEDLAATIREIEIETGLRATAGEPLQRTRTRPRRRRRRKSGSGSGRR